MKPVRGLIGFFCFALAIVKTLEIEREKVREKLFYTWVLD